jgi:NhaP-type Na+/H+ or K+/H+ antiporter
MDGREPTSHSRRRFLAAVLTRAEGDARDYIVGLSHRWPRVSFWVSLLFFVVLGASVLWVWSLTGLSLSLALLILAAVIVLALCEAAYREWRDLEAKFSDGDAI